MKRFAVLLLFFMLFSAVRAQVNEPYYLADFTENELDAVLEVCNKGGFGVLIQKTPFSSYGHYDWNKAFAPRGDQSVIQMVDAADKAGVRLGALVQENAIDTGDSYFSPEYYKQYRKGSQLELYCDLPADETTIALVRCEELKTPSSLNLIMVDDEIISYATLEFSGKLTVIHECTRGAYGTKAADHAVDAKVFRIWESPDHFFEPEGELREMVRQSLEKRLRFFPVILVQDKSGQDWIDATVRVNQVERWEAEGDALSSLGWFMIRATDKRRTGTTMEALEWMLSKAASFGVNYGLSIDPKALKGHGMLNDMLATTSLWNRLLRSGTLTERQRQLLRDPYQDWHLESLDSVYCLLYPQTTSRRYLCHLEETEPGVLQSETWTWNTDDGGAFGLRITVEGEVEILNPMINTTKGLLMFPCAVKPGQRLFYDFGETACVVDSSFNKLDEFFVEGLSELDEGDSEVSFLCEADPEAPQRPVVTLRYITRGRPEPVMINEAPN